MYVLYFFLKWVVKNTDTDCLYSILKISSATQCGVPPQTGNNVQREHFFLSQWPDLLSSPSSDGCDDHQVIITYHQETLHSLEVVSVLLSVTSRGETK